MNNNYINWFDFLEKHWGFLKKYAEKSQLDIVLSWTDHDDWIDVYNSFYNDKIDNNRTHDLFNSNDLNVIYNKINNIIDFNYINKLLINYNVDIKYKLNNVFIYNFCNFLISYPSFFSHGFRNDYIWDTKKLYTYHLPNRYIMSFTVTHITNKNLYKKIVKEIQEILVNKIPNNTNLVITYDILKRNNKELRSKYKNILPKEKLGIISIIISEGPIMSDFKNVKYKLITKLNK